MVSFGRRKGGDAGKPASGAGAISFDPPTLDEGAAVPEGTVHPMDVDAAPEEADDPVASVAQDEAPAAERTTRRFGVGRGASAPKAVKVRQPKVAKPGKAAKGSVEEEISLPLTVIIDFYQGVTKESEAEPIVRANIEKSFDAPNAAFYYMQRWREGMAVEMQEGGRSRLPPRGPGQARRAGGRAHRAPDVQPGRPGPPRSRHAEPRDVAAPEQPGAAGGRLHRDADEGDASPSTVVDRSCSSSAWRCSACR